MSPRPLPPDVLDPLLVERLRGVLSGKVEFAVLFGSLVTGRVHAESDTDIAVWPLAGTDLDRLAGELMGALHTDAVDLADLRRASGTLSQIVATRGRVLHEEKRGRFAAFAALAERRWQDDLRRLPYLVRAIDRWLEDRGIA
ncbi:MAG: nucleotidyltransferase domain-containing protein [Planctomycetes bacterium]|nr:nucleotidyltransferase domain-containing protein [Planctomycetota bacterium]